VIYSIGLLVALDSLDIAISPLLAGFGIGGLALAFQHTPVFFSGTYLVAKGELKEGDFIELEGGPSGFVVEVGWRSTKVKIRFNNLIIIPNSKMIDSILTNYYSPTPTMNVVVTCGVSYDCDLTHVERVVLEITQGTIDESHYAVDNADPSFSFSEFGESNIEFFVLIQANNRTGGFLLKSYIVKKIHSRFENEGIEINYPVRRLVYPDESVLEKIDQHK
jgi:small-conductance mechanosensitive channel